MGPPNLEVGLGTVTLMTVALQRWVRANFPKPWFLYAQNGKKKIDLTGLDDNVCVLSR